MVVENVAGELWRDDELLGRATLHLALDEGRPRGGTMSKLNLVDAMPDLTGQLLTARLSDGRVLQVRVTRHSHPEGITVLRFQVLV